MNISLHHRVNFSIMRAKYKILSTFKRSTSTRLGPICRSQWCCCTRTHATVASALQDQTIITDNSRPIRLTEYDSRSPTVKIVPKGHTGPIQEVFNVNDALSVSIDNVVYRFDSIFLRDSCRQASHDTSLSIFNDVRIHHNLLYVLQISACFVFS